MIRINLLPVDRERRKKRAVLSFGTTTQQVTVACSLILMSAAGICGWRYWTLWKESSAVDVEITQAQQETTRLHSIIQQVQQFEQRKAQLQQRVVLIEQLRKGQTGPVHMLDQISRALPSMLWLTELKQVGNDIVIDGRCTTLTGLSDFVANLEGTNFFKRSIEIVNTQTETLPQPPGELIKFTVRAQLAQPAPAAVGTPAAATPAAPAAPPAAAKVGAP